MKFSSFSFGLNQKALFLEVRPSKQTAREELGNWLNHSLYERVIEERIGTLGVIAFDRVCARKGSVMIKLMPSFQ